MTERIPAKITCADTQRHNPHQRLYAGFWLECSGDPVDALVEETANRVDDPLEELEAIQDAYSDLENDRDKWKAIAVEATKPGVKVGPTVAVTPDMIAQAKAEFPHTPEEYREAFDYIGGQLKAAGYAQAPLKGAQSYGETPDDPHRAKYRQLRQQALRDVLDSHLAGFRPTERDFMASKLEEAMAAFSADGADLLFNQALERGTKLGHQTEELRQEVFRLKRAEVTAVTRGSSNQAELERLYQGMAGEGYSVEDMPPVTAALRILGIQRMEIERQRQVIDARNTAREADLVNVKTDLASARLHKSQAELHKQAALDEAEYQRQAKRKWKRRAGDYARTALYWRTKHGETLAALTQEVKQR
jgi:hypothetical protein